MGDAETQLTIAREGSAGAAERVQQAIAEREQALWPAAIERPVTFSAKWSGRSRRF